MNIREQKKTYIQKNSVRTSKKHNLALVVSAMQIKIYKKKM